jgi:hypothetical protein
MPKPSGASERHRCTVVPRTLLPVCPGLLGRRQGEEGGKILFPLDKFYLFPPMLHRPLSPSFSTPSRILKLLLFWIQGPGASERASEHDASWDDRDDRARAETLEHLLGPQLSVLSTPPFVRRANNAGPAEGPPRLEQGVG